MNKRKFFKRNKKIANRVIRGWLAKNKIGIIHGTRSTNSQLPSKLHRQTQDWDIFVRKPRVRAEQLETALDKKFKGDFFKIKRGAGSPGVKVWKVKSVLTDEGFVDFATPPREVPFIAKRGVRFATLKDQVQKAKDNVTKPELKFRRAKDLDLIRRVNKFMRKRPWL